MINELIDKNLHPVLGWYYLPRKEQHMQLVYKNRKLNKTKSNE